MGEKVWHIHNNKDTIFKKNKSYYPQKGLFSKNYYYNLNWKIFICNMVKFEKIEIFWKKTKQIGYFTSIPPKGAF